MLDIMSENHRVLIVDDEPQVAEALADILEDDFDVTTENSPFEALRLIESSQDISVILCDQRMPKMTGDALLARAKDLSVATRLLITGYADLNAVVKAVNEGKIFGFISKPWDADSLRIAVYRAVEHHDLVRELEFERRLLRDLMTFSPDAIYFMDSENRFVRVNRVGTANLGLTDPAMAIGRRSKDFVLPDVAKEWEDQDRRLLQSGEPIQDHLTSAIDAKGRLRWFSASKAPMRDSTGRITGLVGISRDVTERKQAEQALEKSEAKLRLILDSTTEAIFGIDGKGRCVFCNRACVELLGYDSADAVRGVNMHDLLHPRHPDHNGAGDDQGDCEFERLLASMAHGRIESTTLYKKNGQTLLADVWAHPTVGRDDSLGSVVTFFDVTHQKDLERRLFQSQKMEAVGQLTGGIAHDVNNLLAIIIANLDLMEMHLGDESAVKNMVNDSLTAALRGGDLMRQLLAFSRRQSLKPTTIDIKGLMLELDQLIRRVLREDIEVVIDIASDIWPIKADDAQLESALLNLAVNARDAMPQGGRIAFSVRNSHIDEDFFDPSLEVVAAGDYVVFSAADTGCGIPKDQLDRIFEPFFTTKPTGKGTGLGLSMVYGFTKQSGGYVSVYSEVGHGTTFRLYFPRDGTAEKPSAPMTEVQSSTHQGTLKILLVEDNEKVRKSALRQLESMGHTVHAANNGPAGLKTFDELDEVDLIISDVIMEGGMSGTQMVQELRRRRPDLPVLFVTGYAQGAWTSVTVPEGEVILGKPYRVQQLREKITEAMAGSQGRSINQLPESRAKE